MAIHGKRFDPLSYWEQRLQSHPDITGVGYLGRSPQFVEQQYLSRKYQLELILRHYGLADLRGCNVLDIGSGTGIWLDFWHQHGAEDVVGLDFAQASVNRLKERFPQDLIVQADVSASLLPLPDAMHFDVISAFDVLLHIVDPDGFQRAIANLASHCREGGWLIISDAIVQGRAYLPKYTYAEHNVVRPLSEYRDALTASGFVIDSIQAATILLSNPLEAPNRLVFLALLAWWKATRLWGRFNMASSFLGTAVVKADHLACRCYSGELSPGAKIILAHKGE